MIKSCFGLRFSHPRRGRVNRQTIRSNMHRSLCMQYNHITVKNYTIRLPKCPTFRAIKTGRIDDRAPVGVVAVSLRRASFDKVRAMTRRRCAMACARMDDVGMDVDDGSRRRAGEDARRSEVENACRAIAAAPRWWRSSDACATTSSAWIDRERSINLDGHA